MEEIVWGTRNGVEELGILRFALKSLLVMSKWKPLLEKIYCWAKLKLEKHSENSERSSVPRNKKHVFASITGLTRSSLIQTTRKVRLIRSPNQSITRMWKRFARRSLTATLKGGMNANQAVLLEGGGCLKKVRKDWKSYFQCRRSIFLKAVTTTFRTKQ